MQGKGIFLLSKMQNIGICDALTHVVLLEQNWSCMVCFSEMNFDILKCFSSELRWNSNMWRAPFLKFHLAKGLIACLVYILDEIYHIIDHLALGLHQPQRPSTCWDSDSWVLSSHYYIIPSVLSTQGQAAPKLPFGSRLHTCKVSWLHQNKSGSVGSSVRRPPPWFQPACSYHIHLWTSLHFDLSHTAEKTKVCPQTDRHINVCQTAKNHFFV